MSDVPTVEVYDQDGNWVEVAKVEAKIGGAIVITVAGRVAGEEGNR